MIDALARLLDRAIADGTCPAAQACVIAREEELHASAHGADTDSETLFDIASLTKVMATTTAAYVLLSRGTVSLDDRAASFLPELAGGGKDGILVRHLLAHTSGLPAWLPLFAKAGNRQEVLSAAGAAPLETRPGERCVYSDLGFILLGELLARASGIPFDALCQREIFTALALDDTAFRPLRHRAIAPTGLLRPRPPAPGQEALLPDCSGVPEGPGVVDDDNACAMGGVAGHAGLFSTARDVARWGAAILEERRGAGRLGRAEVLEVLLRPDPHEGPPRALGFDLPSGERPSAGSKLGHGGPLGAAGHLGFTGCSIWLDFDRQLSVALLTNRVFPSRANVAGIQRLRPAFHDAVVEALDG
ncbi:serine hydrolase domain-containing protein [Vulgatibacter incomptus]|uniref:Beta-lactamase class C and other penicillin binding protein n=1 Tax=Vulgatibacter incomptus TaxID=1391653 RepID=A0A0K1PG46_9BACT|nr:serine hydrolase domain-containing protein [Vulgatibacter incomptus]AKU92490.1 Beta-lactamase class C and other penicillin binding protein [Vulgatibacter incomptus]